MRTHFLQSLGFMLGGLLMVLIAPSAADYSRSDAKPLRSAEEFAAALDDKSQKALRSIDFVRREIHRTGARHTMHAQADYLSRLKNEQGISVFAFRNDELILWSTNIISPISVKRVAVQGREIHKFENGWYRLLYLSDGIEEYVATILLKREFPYQNQYLKNDFAPSFRFEGISNIGTKPVKGAVKLKANHQFFYLETEPDAAQTKHNAAIFIILIIAGAALVLRGLLLLMRLLLLKRISRWMVFTLFALASLGLRVWSIGAGWPGFISGLDWFNPTVYASSRWFPSFADLSLNLSLLVILALVARFGLISNKVSRGRFTLLGFWAGMVLLLAYAVFINHLLKGLVLNSNIPFEINVITSLNNFSLLGIVLSAMAYLSFYLLADALVTDARNKGLSAKTLLLPLLLLASAHIVVAHHIGIRDLAFVLWPVAVMGILIATRFSVRQSILRLAPLVVLIALLAGVAAHNFNKYSHKREHNQRLILVEKLVPNNDPVAELLFNDLVKSLSRDRNVQQVFEENELHTRAVLEGYIMQRYFTGYWGNYQVEVYPFVADSSAWGRLTPVRPTSFKEFLRLADQSGEPTAGSPLLLYRADRRDITSYIAIVPLHYSLQPTPDGHLVILLNSKAFGNKSGFPELLVDAKTNLSWRSAEDYATAKYIKGTLRNATGLYPYRRESTIFTNLESYPSFVVKKGFEHLVSKIDDETTIVISLRSPGIIDRLTAFSYISAAFALLFALTQLLSRLLRPKLRRGINLNQKIQILLIGVTLTGMLLLAWATTFYIETNYSAKNRGLVREKMLSITREIQDKLDEEEALDFTMSEHVSRMLSQLSFVYLTDIHLFDTDGDLLASSQLRMFNEGLISRRMNPTAYTSMAHLKLTSFLHEEQIGELAYISGYSPFFNRRGELLGYINLPYFAQQEELQREIASFFETVINLFVILFILSMVVGLFMAQFITAPLRLIRESLSKVELGKTNRIIGYAANDEIGLLVAEYNAKVAELEATAEQLAQGERESAWREMAKQVAHEIRNPLTPMKLNIQYLERSLSRGDAPDPSQIHRLTSNLIEQIDALSAIANAFSDFAKMPAGKEERVTLAEILMNTTSLYSRFENVKVEFRNIADHEAWVSSDKDQLLRVFNNLIKNAIQAIPEGRKGEVLVELAEAPDGGYIASVRDNGIGIDPALAERIFMPNFTTKSRGMGLGLALTRRIVESSRGKIWFESREGQGSTFHVWLPSIKD